LRGSRRFSFCRRLDARNLKSKSISDLADEHQQKKYTQEINPVPRYRLSGVKSK
jgi:hypothetical protein